MCLLKFTLLLFYSVILELNGVIFSLGFAYSKVLVVWIVPHELLFFPVESLSSVGEPSIFLDLRKCIVFQ